MTNPKFQYASCYCEENMWHLCQRTEIGGPQRFVVFIGAGAEFFPMWRQRAGDPEDGIAWWDYHVILISKGDDGAWQVWDQDTHLDLPMSLEDYLSESFPLVELIDSDLQPRFRVIPAETYLSTFSSDRRHMRNEDGQWLAPPPQWPPICRDGIHNLDDFLNVSADGPGTVVGLTDLQSALIDQ
jgi:hypothetical protein